MVPRRKLAMAGNLEPDADDRQLKPPSVLIRTEYFFVVVTALASGSRWNGEYVPSYARIALVRTVACSPPGRASSAGPRPECRGSEHAIHTPHLPFSLA